MIISNPNEDYRSRTIYNATNAEVTLAFGYDFSTPGERLTKGHSNRYASFNFNESFDVLSDKIQMVVIGGMYSNLNIAGNGSYTLIKYGMDQLSCNLMIYRLLKSCNDIYAINHIRSGGQTGADIAGIVAAIVLGVPYEVYFPKNYLTRTVEGYDEESTLEEINDWINNMVIELKDEITKHKY